jgi:Uma2 family endonuclease
MTLEEFLALPEEKPYAEFIDGEVVRKVAPAWNHSLLVLELGSLLRSYLRDTREGVVHVELRHLLAAEERVFLPDLSVIVSSRVPPRSEARRVGPIETIPDLAIEVLSPEDRPGRVLEKVDFYLRAGVQLIWVIDPDLEAITVYRRGIEPQMYRSPALLDAQPVLRGFELDLGQLLAVLHEDETEE